MAAEDAVMAAESGYYGFALKLLGRAMHPLQDEFFHEWVDMSKQHTGRCDRVLYNWTIGWGTGMGEGRQHDLIDLLSKPSRGTDARDASAKLLKRFEAAVRAKAKAMGVNPDKVINGLKNYKRR